MEEFKEKSSHQSSWENETANKLIYFLYVFLVKKVTEAVHTFEIKYAKLRQLTQKGEGPQERGWWALACPSTSWRLFLQARNSWGWAEGAAGAAARGRAWRGGRLSGGWGVIVKGMGSLD